ncbi:MAG: alpha/beta hydrolase [Lachnospiraceae bacterium]|nr:alpha/beta hydrolase [Lachnospiraceae bacterium]
MSTATDALRTAFSKADMKRDMGLTTPTDIIRYDNICYGTDTKWQMLDVYRPQRSEGQKLPVIISVHGGGWVYGDKELYQYYCMNLATRGFAVVNFTYRLAPDFKFPSSLEDTNLVVQWVLVHGDDYGFDLDYIFGVGDSAGAHILGLYAAVCTNPDYAAEYDFTVPKGFTFTALCLNCGQYHFDKADQLDAQTKGLMADLLPNRGTDEELMRISLDRYVTGRFPQTFLMTCSGDFLKEQAGFLSEQLNIMNVPFEYHFYGTAEHILGHVFHLDIRNDMAKKCNDTECTFFKGFLPAAKTPMPAC